MKAKVLVFALACCVSLVSAQDPQTSSALDENVKGVLLARAIAEPLFSSYEGFSCDTKWSVRMKGGPEMVLFGKLQRSKNKFRTETYNNKTLIDGKKKEDSVSIVPDTTIQVIDIAGGEGFVLWQEHEVYFEYSPMKGYDGDGTVSVIKKDLGIKNVDGTKVNQTELSLASKFLDQKVLVYRPIGDGTFPKRIEFEFEGLAVDIELENLSLEVPGAEFFEVPKGFKKIER